MGVIRGDSEVAALFSARRVGKSLLDFVRSFIDITIEIIIFSEIC